MPVLSKWYGPRGGQRTFGQSVLRVGTVLVLCAIAAGAGVWLDLPKQALLVAVLPAGFLLLD